MDITFLITQNLSAGVDPRGETGNVLSFHRLKIRGGGVVCEARLMQHNNIQTDYLLYQMKNN